MSEIRGQRTQARGTVDSLARELSHREPVADITAERDEYVRVPPRPSTVEASGFDGAGSVNGDPAKKPRDWRKSYVQNHLRLRLDDLCSGSRSATLPNEVMQKRGEGRSESELMKVSCWGPGFSRKAASRRDSSQTARQV